MADPDRLEALRTFVTMITGTNDAIQHELGQIKEHTEEINGRREESTADLTELAHQAEQLKHVVETIESDITKEAHQLQETTEHAHQERLPAVADGITAAEQDLEAALGQDGQELDTALASLQTDGFDPLEGLLESEQSDFERWTTEGATALAELGEAVRAAQTELERDDTQAVDAIGEAAQAGAQAHQTLHGLLAIADHIGGDLGHEVESRTAACAQELEQLLDDWTAAVGTAINARHHSLEQLAQKAVEAIHEEGTTTMTSLEGASHALEAAHQQFDQAAGEVESSHATVSTVAGLAPGVQKAEGEVAEIRALLDSVGTP